MLGTEDERQDIAFLGMRCLYELQDIEITRSVANEFNERIRRDGKLCLKRLTITPNDATAFFEFLRNVENLTQLEFIDVKLQGEYVFQKIVELFSNKPRRHNQQDKIAINSGQLTGLVLRQVPMSDSDVKYLCDGLNSEECELSVLNVNGIKCKGVKYLCDVLRSGHCKLTTLNLSGNVLSSKAVGYLCEVLRSANNNLTTLDLSNIQINTEEAKRFLIALSKNCKLTSFDLSDNDINYETLTKYFTFRRGSELGNLNAFYIGKTGDESNPRINLCEMDN